MSLLVKLIYDTSELHRRYRSVHGRIFGFSVRRVIDGLRPQSQAESRINQEQLQALASELGAMRVRLGKLDECDLTKRSGRDLCATLADYVAALEGSVLLLGTICRRMERERRGEDGFRNYTGTGYRKDRITYDDAIQHHKRLGKRLQELLSTF